MGLMDKAVDKAMEKAVPLLDAKFAQLVAVLERMEKRLEEIEDNTRRT